MQTKTKRTQNLKIFRVKNYTNQTNLINNSPQNDL